jgi:hypothetical protein
MKNQYILLKMYSFKQILLTKSGTFHVTMAVTAIVIMEKETPPQSRIELSNLSNLSKPTETIDATTAITLSVSGCFIQRFLMCLLNDAIVVAEKISIVANRTR